MRVHVYALCWNEERMLPFFLRHYDSIAEKFVVYDNGSTDASLEILNAHRKVDLRHYTVEGESFVEAARRMYDTIWKGSRGEADWVVVCNVDEHYFHENLPGYLNQCKAEGVTVIPSAGFEMITEQFPTSAHKLCDVVTRGARATSLDKIGIFDPNAIEEINYVVGRHGADPVGQVVYPSTVELKLLHFKYLGLPYLKSRYAELSQRLRIGDIEKRWGYQYLWDGAEVESAFARVDETAKAVVEGRVASSNECVEAID